MSDRDSDPSEGSGGLAAAARAVGKAFGFLRWGRSGRDEANEPAAKRTTVATSKRQASPRVTPAETEALQSEIQRLESELDAIYVKLGRSEHRATELSPLVERTRQLKEQLGEKRRRLSKLERDSARERLLGALAGDAASEVSRPAPAVKGKKVAPPRSKRQVEALPTAPAKRRASEQRSEASSSDRADRAERLLLDKLKQNLNDSDPEIRRAAAARLSEIDSTQARELATSATNDTDERVQSAALHALALQATPASAPVFRRFVGHVNPHLRLAALRGLARLDAPDAHRLLIDALDDEHPLTRRTAATLLGWREAIEATGPLILALRDEDPAVRAAAASALSTLRQDRAVLPLIRALGDEAEAVREAALTSLRSLAGDDIEIAQDEKHYTPGEIEVLKKWWRKGRLERRLIPIEGMPDAIPERAEPERSAAEPGTAANGANVESAPEPPKQKAAPEPPKQKAAPEPPKQKAAPEPPKPVPIMASTNNLDDLLGGDFKVASTESAGESDKAGDQEEGGQFEPLDGLLSDLGAHPVEPEKP